MTLTLDPEAGRCPRCTHLHLGTLPCWSGRYAMRTTRLTLTTQGTTCWLCGTPGADSADHVIPRSKGGTDKQTNLRPAHRQCNSARNNRDPFRPDPAHLARGAEVSARWEPSYTTRKDRP